MERAGHGEWEQTALLKATKRYSCCDCHCPTVPRFFFFLSPIVAQFDTRPAAPLFLSYASLRTSGVNLLSFDMRVMRIIRFSDRAEDRKEMRQNKQATRAVRVVLDMI